MERWKQRNSLNLDTKFGKNYIGKLFGSGSSYSNSKSSSINGEGAFNNKEETLVCAFSMNIVYFDAVLMSNCRSLLQIQFE